MIVMNTTEYENKMQQLLNDQTTYQKIYNNPTTRLQKTI